METLTRAHIIKGLGQNAELPADQSSSFLERTLEMLISSLIQDGQVKISGFGSFNVRKKLGVRGEIQKQRKLQLHQQELLVLFKSSAHLRKRIQRSRGFLSS